MSRKAAAPGASATLSVAIAGRTGASHAPKICVPLDDLREQRGSSRVRSLTQSRSRSLTAGRVGGAESVAVRVDSPQPQSERRRGEGRRPCSRRSSQASASEPAIWPRSAVAPSRSECPGASAETHASSANAVVSAGRLLALIPIVQSAHLASDLSVARVRDGARPGTGEGDSNAHCLWPG